MEALIVGASGLTGSFLVKELIESGKYSKVVSLVRKKGAYTHDRLIQIETDFHQTPLLDRWSEIKHVFCCLGSTIKKAGSKEAFRFVDFEIPLALAKEAKKNNVDHFLIITALGANAESSIFYNQVKGELETELKKINFPRLSILQPSLLLGDRKEERRGEKIGQWLAPFLSLILIGGLAKYKPIQAKAVAHAMQNIAWRTDAGDITYHSGKIKELGNE